MNYIFCYDNHCCCCCCCCFRFELLSQCKCAQALTWIQYTYSLFISASLSITLRISLLLRNVWTFVHCSLWFDTVQRKSHLIILKHGFTCSTFEYFFLLENGFYSSKILKFSTNFFWVYLFSFFTFLVKFFSLFLRQFFVIFIILMFVSSILS